MIARTWILVADATYARIFELAEPDRRWKLVEELEHPESREQGRDLVGNRPYKRQHQMEMSGKNENPSELKHLEAGIFAHQLADHLSKKFAGNAFDQLVLVAAPKMLGLLREKLPTQLKKLVVTEIDKDYSNLEAREMEDRVPIF